MSSLFELAVKTELNDSCGGLLPIFKVIRQGIFPIIWIGIPIVLILMGTIDLGKAVLASDDNEIKAAQGRLFKRVLYAAVIFFMATIVSLVMNVIGKAGTDAVEGNNDWTSCWAAAAK